MADEIIRQSYLSKTRTSKDEIIDEVIPDEIIDEVIPAVVIASDDNIKKDDVKDTIVETVTEIKAEEAKVEQLAAIQEDISFLRSEIIRLEEMMIKPKEETMPEAKQEVVIPVLPEKSEAPSSEETTEPKPAKKKKSGWTVF